MTTISTATPTIKRTSVTPLVLYFVLSYALTWLFWIPAGLQETGRLALPLPVFLMQILGGLGPMLAAILVAAAAEGKAGVGKLFQQLLRYRVGARWYGLALIVVPLLALVDLPLHLAFGGSLQLQDLVPLLMIVPVHFLFVALLGGGLGEEMGWRGYALPRLQAHLHPVGANLLLGVLWSGWHLPLWFIPGTFQSAQSFPIYLVGTTAMSFLLGLIYNGSGGSLLLAVLAHSASNAADNLRVNLLGNLAPEQLTQYQLLRIVLLVAVAVLAVVITRGKLGTGQEPSRE